MRFKIATEGGRISDRRGLSDAQWRRYRKGASRQERRQGPQRRRQSAVCGCGFVGVAHRFALARPSGRVWQLEQRVSAFPPLGDEGRLGKCFQCVSEVACKAEPVIEQAVPAEAEEPIDQSELDTSEALSSIANEQQPPASKPRESARVAKDAEQAPGKAKAPDTIRLPVAAIQRIMDLVSELVLTRNQIMDLSRQHNISQIKSPLESCRRLHPICRTR